MLRWLSTGRRPRPSTRSTETVLRATPASPIAAGALAAHLHRVWPDGPVVEAPSSGEDGGQDDRLVLRIPGGDLQVVSSLLPIPETDLNAPARLAWHWPNAARDVGRHRCQVVCTIRSSVLGPLERRLLLTHAVTGLLDDEDVLGVYCAASSLLVRRDTYLKCAAPATATTPPVLIWVGLFPVREDDGHASAYTRGMPEFGFLDFELRGSGQSPTRLFELLSDLCVFTLQQGVQFADGDVIGRSVEDRAVVRHARSRFLPAARVAMIEL